MLDNSSGVVIRQRNAKVVNCAADSYICDRLIQHNSSPTLRYISPPIRSKFPKWTETHKLERTEIRLEIMIELLREHKPITNPVDYMWCAKECQRFNDETKLLLQLAKKKGLLDLKFKSKVQKHVTEVKQLLDRVKIVTRDGLINQLLEDGPIVEAEDPATTEPAVSPSDQAMSDEPTHICLRCLSKFDDNNPS